MPLYATHIYAYVWRLLVHLGDCFLETVKLLKVFCIQMHTTQGRKNKQSTHTHTHTSFWRHSNFIRWYTDVAIKFLYKLIASQLHTLLLIIITINWRQRRWQWRHQRQRHNKIDNDRFVAWFPRSKKITTTKFNPLFMSSVFRVFGNLEKKNAGNESDKPKNYINFQNM